MKKILVYYVAFGQADISHTEMCVNSLRETGFSGDVLVFVDKPAKVYGANTFNVRDSKPLLEALDAPFKDQLWHKRDGVDLDYIYAKIALPRRLTDLSFYDVLVYSDTDILIYDRLERWLPMDVIGVHKDEVSMLENINRGKILVQEGVSQEKIAGPGACGGFLSLPRSEYSFLETWDAAYIESRKHTQCFADQPILNYLLASRNFKYIEGLDYCERQPGSKAVHYWWNYRDSLSQRYDELISEIRSKSGGNPGL